MMLLYITKPLIVKSDFMEIFHNRTIHSNSYFIFFPRFNLSYCCSVMLTELNSNTYENFTIQDSNVVITDLIPYGSYEVSVRTVHNGAYSEPVVGRIQLGSLLFIYVYNVLVLVVSKLQLRENFVLCHFNI